MSDTDEKSQAAKPGAAKPDVKEWPNTIRARDELDSALDAGLKSGRSARKMKEIIKDEISRIESG